MSNFETLNVRNNLICFSYGTPIAIYMKLHQAFIFIKDELPPKMKKHLEAFLNGKSSKVKYTCTSEDLNKYLEHIGVHVDA